MTFFLNAIIDLVVREERLRVFLAWLGLQRGGKEDPDQGAQKPREPAQEEAEVVAGGGQDRIAAIAVAALEGVAGHAVFGLGVADDRLDRGTALHSVRAGLSRWSRWRRPLDPVPAFRA